MPSLPLASCGTSAPTEPAATPAHAPIPAADTGFVYEPTVQLGHDETPYRLLSREHVSTVALDGKTYLRVAPEALRLLARTAFNDISFYLRPAHLRRLREELADPEASDNDRFVIYTHLQNAVTASAGLLPTCQDTVTAIIMGKKGQRVLTNADDAIDFKVVTAPLTSPERANWRDLIPYRPGTYVIDLELYSGHMVRLERANALPSIVIRDLATGNDHAIAFDEAAYSLDTHGGYEFDTTTLRFGYSSMTTPAEVFDYDMATRERILRKRQEIPSGHNPADYVTTRIMAKANDGAEVPVSILHRKDFARDGKAPLLLYGYGSYGHAIPASFSANRLSLVDRGFVYAIAHIRGGSDKGWGWYLDGKREKKTNSFDDFAACGRALIAANYTSAKKIVGHGGSAGGMLMGAAANRSGDLFAGIIAEVPFVDVLNTMLDHSLPRTPPEWPECGNPTESAGDFKTILSYSPYDNLAARAYPAILAMGGLTDPRVTYWEPAKWIARLRATMTSGGPVLLRTNMGAGHGGASGRFDRLDEVAIGYAFALWAVGLVDKGGA